MNLDNLEPFLTAGVRAAILEHMQEEAPKECCGLIVRSLYEPNDYVYERCLNMHEKPEESFAFSEADSLRVSTDNIITAIVHSHPNGPIGPSKADMLSYRVINKPYVIAACDPATGSAGVYSMGDHLLDAPLIGRPWLYGVFDCLEALRGWYWQERDVYLPQVPRTDWWWDGDRQDEVEEDDRDMYMRNIIPWGFEEFKPDFDNPSSVNHPLIGDVILMQIESPVVNHAAIYVGNNLLYHHRFGKPSGENPTGYFADVGVIRHWCRYKGATEDE